MPRPASEETGPEPPVPEPGRPAEETLVPPPGEQPPAWWVKLLVWVIVAALCLAFAGLVWALAL